MSSKILGRRLFQQFYSQVKSNEDLFPVFADNSDRQFDGTGSFQFPYGDPVGRVNWDMTKTDGLIETVHGQHDDADALFEILDKLKTSSTPIATEYP